MSVSVADIEQLLANTLNNTLTNPLNSLGKRKGTDEDDSLNETRRKAPRLEELQPADVVWIDDKEEEIEPVITDSKISTRPVLAIHDELWFCQASRTIAWSPQGMIAWVSHENNSKGIAVIKARRQTRHGRNYGGVTGYSFNEKENNQTLLGTLKYTAKPSFTIPTEKHHSNIRNITNIVFNQTGNCLASIDKAGVLVLWIMDDCINNWTCLWEDKFDEPIVAFCWLPSERVWEARKNDQGEISYKRAALRGPKNGFGKLAFVVLTSSGKISVWYQRERKTFLKITPEVTTPLSSINAWSGQINCISHADILINKDGRILLVTHSANAVPRVVKVFELAIDLLQLNVECLVTTTIQPKIIESGDAIHDPFIHVKLLPATENNSDFKIVIVSSGKESEEGDTGEQKYRSDLFVYAVCDNSSEARETRTRNNKMIKPLVHENFAQRLITTICEHDNELLLAFNDGCTEFRDCVFFKPIVHESNSCAKAFSNNSLPALSDWLHRGSRGNIILEYAVSPNRAWLACRLASGKLEFLDIAESGRFRQALRSGDGTPVVNVMAHTLIGALLNNRDHADIENIVRRASRLKEDFVEQVLTEMFNHIENLIPKDLRSMYTSEFAHKLLGVQISLLKCRGTEKIINDVQFINTWALMQLYGVDSAMHCRPVDTDYSNAGIFVYRTLADMTDWFMAFTITIVKDLYVYFMTEEPNRDITAEKSHLPLLYNTAARTSIRNIITSVKEVRRDVEKLASEHSEMSQFRDVKKQLDFGLKSSIVPFEAFEKLLDSITPIIENGLEGDDERRRVEYSVVLRAVLPESLHKDLKEIKIKFCDFINQINPEKLYFSELNWLRHADVVRKSKIKNKTRPCTHYTLGSCCRTLASSGFAGYWVRLMSNVTLK
ncbi:78_t:CDS:10 [Paraglomus occultum]|uniref:Mediator of RNA polymerase II transcription subunit 16 n=1 Tax=Paraglomus occultum TaxID=144539 RepID=A0A9N8WKV8_9GLOM|nr:78_t:CDS:10 [Paraglomus occultum]